MLMQPSSLRKGLMDTSLSQPSMSSGCGVKDEDHSRLSAPRGALIRSIKDPIHVHVHALLSRFIDTRQFQRLRDVKQLGTSSFVWPGASHSRFEHCLGVAHLSRVLASRLQRNQPELGITDRDVECVEIAGLCHDLGHGPWSHVWDGMFMPRALPGRKWKHEQGSEMMFDFLIAENEIPIPEKDRHFIKALIEGDPSKCYADEKKYLFDIVANKRNGLDVDKFDYIQRDSHMIGDRIGIDSNRIVNSARVIDHQICYDIKDANQIYEICATRFKLHKMIYNHKAAKAIEYMIIDALLAAESYMHIAERVFDPERFVYLNDSILNHIESSTAMELEKSRSIIRRIRDRDLYKCVDYKVIEWNLRDLFKEHVTSTKIAEEARRSFPDYAHDLKDDDVIVDFATMHYGMGKDNPLQYVKFYSKRDPTHCRNAEKGDYSNLQPACFAEVMLRVYTKKPEHFGRVQFGYRKILDWLNSTQIPEGPNVGRLTPPVTEAPSTPRSRAGSFNLSSESIGRGRTSTTPFSNNNFTTVAPTYAATSPTRRGRKRSRGRRSESPSRKRRG